MIRMTMKTTPEEEARATTTTEGRKRQTIGRFVSGNSTPEARPLALFCFDAPDSFIGGHVARLAAVLAKRGQPVRLFTRVPFPSADANVQNTVVGGDDEGDVVEQARAFAGRAGNAFMEAFPGAGQADVIAYEWSAAGVLPLLKGLRNQTGILSLHSLERQRSDLSSDVARRIHALECEALQSARAMLCHDTATADAARTAVPACGERIVSARGLFDPTPFEVDLDPGAVKARYDIGPLDPIIVYVGDLEERYGPDLILKAMPALLRHHKTARLLIVGDGSQFWPLRVFSRYLLLDHAVHLLGSITGTPCAELIRAADVMVVPSRESTPWWPIQAAWAAGRPVVATHEAARGLVEHEKDSVLVYPSENSLVWGVERVLYDAALQKAIGAAGRVKLEQRFGFNALAEQVEEMTGRKEAVVS